MNNDIKNQIPSGWTIGEKVAFRFFCLFFILHILPFPVAYIPFMDAFWNRPISNAYSEFWHTFVPWVGEHILRLPNRITTFENGSGDTTYNYVQLFTMLSLSLIGTLIWSILDRKRVHYQAAHFGLRALVRYYLAFVLLSYGTSKIFYVQMLPPKLYELIQPFGDRSPMGLAWSYVGYSKAFSMITGWAEVTGGVLLLFRKTVTLGSLLNVFVLGNIVIMNFCFDVPVKLYSSTLWIMSLFLLAPDVKRLTRALVTNKATLPADLRYPVAPKWVKAGTVIKFAFFAFICWTLVEKQLRKQKSVGEDRPKPPLYGLFEVKEFVRGNEEIPLLVTDTTLWRNFVVEFKGNAMIKFMNDSMQRYVAKVDTVAQTIQMHPFYPVKDTADKSLLHYQLNGDRLVFDGAWSGDSVKIFLERKDASRYRLISRGFRWINESPYHY